MGDLTIYRGRTWRRRLTVTNAATGQRSDLTGAAIEFRVKPHTNDPDPATIALSVGAGVTLLAQSGATLGQADIQVDDTSSIAIAAGAYVGTALVTLSGNPIPHVVIPPTRIQIRDLP